MRLIRIENLLIIAVTQLCIKYLIFQPINTFSKFTPFLFFTSLLSTLLIAAAGYIINDYFDVKTDKINRPGSVVIDVVIKRRIAMILHVIFNIIGLILSLYIALVCHNIKLVLIQFVSILLLWFYSTHFKKQLLIGNIIVATLTAIIPLIPLVYEYFLIGGIDPITYFFLGNLLTKLVTISCGYAAFAFLTSLTREVIKDMQDYEGDVQTGCRTMPIVWGIITSKVVSFFLILITIGLLLTACLKFYKDNDYHSIYYVLILLILPLFLLIFQTIRAKNSHDFKIASLILKIIMLLGIIFSFVITFWGH